MAGERRKRQQRVRHEVGGASSGNVSTPEPSSNSKEVHEQPKSNDTKSNAPTQSTSASSSRQQRGGGSSRGKKGVSVATVDETKYYQPVTIMENKSETKPEELDDTPQKYKRRGIVSNWSRYEERPLFLDEVEDGSDYLIGEDFADVLHNQSQSTGAHLQLKGEESWGFTEDVMNHSGVGMGALKMSDVASTIVTIPLGEQVLMEENKIPAQLWNYYNELASDNRKMYDPNENTKEVVDTTDIIEQQMQKLRIAFFEGDSKSKDDKNIRNIKKHDNSVKSSNEMELFESVECSIDFNAPAEETLETENSPSTVDLTSKMCEVFGSVATDDQDGFAGFITPASEETSETNATSYVDSKQINSLSALNTDGKTDSLGSFNFGLPKLNASDSPTPLNLASLHQLNQRKDDGVDVFTPALTKQEEVKKEEPVIDLNAPIIPKAVAPLVQTKEDTKDLEDWLDTVLDD